MSKEGLGCLQKSSILTSPPPLPSLRTFAQAFRYERDKSNTAVRAKLSGQAETIKKFIDSLDAAERGWRTKGGAVNVKKQGKKHKKKQKKKEGEEDGSGEEEVSGDEEEDESDSDDSETETDSEGSEEESEGGEEEEGGEGNGGAGMEDHHEIKTTGGTEGNKEGGNEGRDM